jgi:flagellar assembly factor FliW
MRAVVISGAGGGDRGATPTSESTTPPSTNPSEITFTQAIPGFAGLKRFVLVRLDDADAAVSELRSLERPEVRFVVVTPGIFFSDYAIELDDQQCSDLGLTSADDVLVLVMLTVGHDGPSTTANLLAPVVINVRTRAAAQIILTGSDWPVRAPLG